MLMGFLLLGAAWLRELAWQGCVAAETLADDSTQGPSGFRPSNGAITAAGAVGGWDQPRYRRWPMESGVS